MSMEEARALIAQAGVVASFSGSGLSRESGIHTFRDDDGIWTKVDPMKMASIEGFLADPEGVTEWYDERRKFIAAARPNDAHRALAGFTGMVHITQNIDRLLEKAGAPRVVHLHGHIDEDHCLEECGYSEVVDPLEPRGLRTCASCGALMRPSIVLFGEMLPEGEWMRAHMAVVAADVLLVVGTSAEVYPAAGLIALARDHGARVIVVNTQPSAASGLATVELIGQAGDILPELLA
jgi:NAD-dependent deacetylase